ncbi:HAD hydrolase-like protein [Mucilaginibacter robiniae]|uniref:HAD hydrolase-like protein n=1 Tax=Mucilaginibacter robiniae TaxID=2728022 RepID=A0A7L5E2Y2_9SPHI|nr:HAD hydrolase-like protein [Mucilaginibacter robiniae]
MAVSNEGRELTNHCIKEFKMNPFMDFFISSSFVHLRKPSSDIFQMALDIAQIDAEEVLYIDDHAIFVRVAESLGIKGV